MWCYKLSRKAEREKERDLKCYTGGSEDGEKTTSREMQAASRNLERQGDGFFPRTSRRNVGF